MGAELPHSVAGIAGQRTDQAVLRHDADPTAYKDVPGCSTGVPPAADAETELNKMLKLGHS